MEQRPDGRVGEALVVGFGVAVVQEHRAAIALVERRGQPGALVVVHARIRVGPADPEVAVLLVQGAQARGQAAHAALELEAAFAVVFGKEVFGGTGMNVFNPALLARAFAFFAYTPSMSGATVWIAGMTSGEGVVDGFSGATALENLSTTGRMGYSAMDAFLGFIPGCVGETSTLAILIGAAILLFTGVASWRTMVSVFVGGLAMGYLFQALGVTTYPAWWHLIVGGFAFGAVFMATDPVTSAQTDRANTSWV